MVASALAVSVVFYKVTFLQINELQFNENFVYFATLCLSLLNLMFDTGTFSCKMGNTNIPIISRKEFNSQPVRH